MSDVQAEFEAYAQQMQQLNSYFSQQQQQWVNPYSGLSAFQMPQIVQPPKPPTVTYVAKEAEFFILDPWYVSVGYWLGDLAKKLASSLWLYCDRGGHWAILRRTHRVALALDAKKQRWCRSCWVQYQLREKK